jgi:hypothetical protein
MNDFEARLRNSLRRNLDPVDATRQLPDDVASKARTRRFIMIVGTGMAVVLLAVSTTWRAAVLSSNPSQSPVAPGPSESPVESAGNGKIAFDMGGDLYLMDHDGTGLRNLTRTRNVSELDPAWSTRWESNCFRRLPRVQHLGHLRHEC